MNVAELIAKYEELRAAPQAAGAEPIPDLLTVAAKLGPPVEQLRAAGIDFGIILTLIPMLLGILFPTLPPQFAALIQQIIQALLGKLT